MKSKINMDIYEHANFSSGYTEQMFKSINKNAEAVVQKSLQLEAQKATQQTMQLGASQKAMQLASQNATQQTMQLEASQKAMQLTSQNATQQTMLDAARKATIFGAIFDNKSSKEIKRNF